MNILITGGAGFIGSNLVRRIIDEPEARVVVNLDCLTYAGHPANLWAVQSHPKYRHEKVDVRDRDEVARAVRDHEITHVMHLAAESHVDRSIAGPGAFVHTNIVGTFNLLEACRQFWLGSPARTTGRFLHVSTDEVYGSLGPTGRFTEASPYAPSSPYSASKASADMLVRAYHHTYGLPAIVTNCSNNYGPYQFPEKLIPVAIQCVLDRRSIPVYGDGLNVRDWLYVRDHVEALWSVLLRGRVGETYNLGGNSEASNLQVVHTICDMVDELAPALGGGSRSLIRFVTDRPGHDRRYAIDASKVLAEVGWSPSRAFPQGIRETVRWYLDNQDWVALVQGKQNPGGFGAG